MEKKSPLLVDKIYLSSFFSSIVAFCRHFCRLYARVLRLCRRRRRRSALPLSLSLSLSLSRSFPRFAPPRRREKRRRPFERRRRKRRRRGVACFRFGERRDTRLRLDFSSSLVFLFKGGRVDLKTQRRQKETKVVFSSRSKKESRL